jgi:hypothetical protein
VAYTGTDGAAEITAEANNTLLDNLMFGASSLFSLVGSAAETEFVGKKAVAQIVVGAGLGAFILGDRFGGRIPVIGGGRK